jgi:GH43 family beta-xylosidase
MNALPRVKYFLCTIFISTAVLSFSLNPDKNKTRVVADSLNGVFTNPLLPAGPDPWALYHDGTYYYMNTMQNRLVLWKTKDITDLKNAPQKTIWIPTDPKNNRDLWAPEIHFINGKWYVYYAADDGNTDNHQLYVLENTSKDPFEGEFVMKGHISTDKDNNWAIDGSVFQHKGEWYMVWSGWQTRRIDTETQCIYIARLENPWTLSSERVRISIPELDWEKKYINPDGWTPSYIIYVNEGPQPLKSPKGKYIHVVYSASGCWTPFYALGMLTASTNANLLDPKSWVKSPEPLFRQAPENKVYGTGHNSFFKSPDGKEDYILYHARDTETDPPGKGDTRSPRAQKINWNNQDYPVFGIPEPTSAKLKKPSGTVTKK